MNKRHLTITTAVLAAALTLSACGSNDLATGTTPASSGAHGGAHGGTTSSTPAAPAALANDVDIAFLTGMKPHHQQAVEMSDIVLTTDPPAAVAALADQIKAAQSPEIQQIDRMLTDLGQPTDRAASGQHSAGHAGMLSDGDMATLRDARRIEASRLYLEGMVAHHEGAIQAADAELRGGRYEPARQLAARIAEDQAAEITEMEALLASL